MNAILSILVCIAMLFSGGAALPEQPETATVRTLRNLTIATDEGSVTLTPELRLTTAIGSELGGRDHTTVMHGCDQIARMLQADPTLRKNLDDLKESLLKG